MIRKRKLLSAFLLLILFYSPVIYADDDIYQQTYQFLDTVVAEKKKQLIDFCANIKTESQKIKTDQAMIEFFHLKRQYYSLRKHTPPPEKLQQNIEKMKKGIQNHYIRNYNMFYDLLMIDVSGDIFFTIRKEDDYHRNIFDEDLAETNLSKILANKPENSFIDFQYFIPSQEPAAFFIEPVYQDEYLVGWFVFQCAINKINSLFLGYDHLGETGEVFLVNKEQFMLTDSRFTGDSGTLRIHLNPDNIITKFQEKKGKKTVVDYRGFRVLSCFEVFSFLDTEWLIIAKIDEDEIITNWFTQHQKDFFKEWYHTFPVVETSGKFLLPYNENSNKVDMDEFVRVNNHENLYTKGVSTCTGFIASYPGKFAYVAHITPYDKIYNPPVLYTDLLSQILKRMTYFDIYKYERRKLKFYIISNHLNTVETIVNQLIKNGFFLSQIYFLYNPQAEYAAFFYNYDQDSLSVKWKLNDQKKSMLFLKEEEKLGNIGEQIKNIRTGDKVKILFNILKY